MTKNPKSYTDEITVFLNGMIIMIIEIVGARMISPYCGASTYVWTAVIGIILTALSLGYWQGGKIADTDCSDKKLSKVFLIATISLSITTTLNQHILVFILYFIQDLRVQAILATTLLFAIPSFFLAMVSPLVARRKTNDLQHLGDSIGSIYALGTLGSIFGTFLAGFWLTDNFSNTAIMWGLIFTLLLLSTINKLLIFRSLAALLFILFSIHLNNNLKFSIFKNTVHESSTAYANYIVYDSEINSKKARFISTDRFSYQTGIYLEGDNVTTFNYINSGFIDVFKQHPESKRILILGGGAYSLPTILNQLNPELIIDVVEIDPKLDQIAIDYFKFKPQKNINLIHEDARTYLNRNQLQYDIIYFDIFSSLRPPFHLTTAETAAQAKRSLAPNGLIAINVIASQTGQRSNFLAAMMSTFKSVFENTYLISTGPTETEKLFQNYILISSNESVTDSLQSYISSKQVLDYDKNGLVLSDNFAPLEKLLGLM